MSATTNQTPDNHAPPIRRILVALNSSPDELELIDAALQWAGKLHAELAGLFVEDITLLELAEFPFALEVQRALAQRREVDRQRMERWLRAEARRVRSALEQRAEGRAVRWRFELARGDILAETLTAAHQSDLLIISRRFQDALIQGRRSAVVAAIIAQAECAVLIAGKDGHDGSAVYAVVHEGSVARRVLAAAARFAAIDRMPLVVVNTAATLELCAQQQTAVRALLAGHPGELRFEDVAAEAPSDWLHGIDFKRSELLVMDRDSVLADEHSVEALVDELSCPVLLIN